jgi:hypothetical protein
MPSLQPFLYENVTEHWKGGWPVDRPRTAAATYTGLYVSWALLSRLGSGTHHGNVLRLQSLTAREVTPGTFYFETLGGVFDDTVLNTDGNEFTTLYYYSHFRAYSDDYLAVAPSDLRFFFDVPDTWDRFDALRPLVDRRYRMWRECSGSLEDRVRQFTNMTGFGPGPGHDPEAWTYSEAEVARLIEHLRARGFH